MKMSIECYPCLLQQVLNTTNLIGLQNDGRKKVMDYALHHLAHHGEDVYPHEIVVAIYRFIEEHYGRPGEIFDPYAEIKTRTRKIAERFYSSVRHTIEASQVPLEAAVKCAVLGNIIDFGAKDHGSLDVGKELAKLDDLEFAIYDYQELAERMAPAKRILYIGDNVGEDVFDRAFIAEIRKEYPGCEVVFAVRERAVINDVTIDDAIACGMEQVARVISSGSIYPGTILSRTSFEFRRLFQQAELVIAKGQGNYETLVEESHPGMFFLLRAKCQRVADKLGVERGSMILQQQRC